MTPEQQEIQIKKEEVSQLEQQLADVETQYAELCMEFSQFELEYQDQVASYYHQLDRWTLRIYSTQMMIEKLREVRDGLRPVPLDPFKWSAECISDVQEQWFQDQQQRSMDEDIDEKPISSKDFDPKEAKKVYRQLAKKFHPDLVESEDARERRTDVMTEINLAYQRQDLETLKELLFRPEIKDPRMESAGDILVRLIRRTAQLRSFIQEADTRLEKEMTSELMDLYRQCQETKMRTGKPFSALKQALEEQIERAKFEWMCQRARESKLWTEVE
jgi:hypothetical protein